MTQDDGPPVVVNDQNVVSLRDYVDKAAADSLSMCLIPCIKWLDFQPAQMNQPVRIRHWYHCKHPRRINIHLAKAFLHGIHERHGIAYNQIRVTFLRHQGFSYCLWLDFTHEPHPDEQTSQYYLEGALDAMPCGAQRDYCVSRRGYWFEV